MAPGTASAVPGITRRDRFALTVQAGLARLTGPVTIPAVVLAMKWFGGWRIRDHRELRRRFRLALRQNRGAVMIVANHLSYFDSVVIAWALGPVWWYLLFSSRLPWNVPERRNFAASPMARMLTYVYKCIPISRGGDREQVSRVLDKLCHLLGRGAPVMMFPEGGRSRSGRIDRSKAAYGVGRVIKAVPGLKVLCVYLRGDHQVEHTVWPARGETFELAMTWLEPSTKNRGLRGSVDLTNQILDRLEEMEKRYFDGRQ